MTSPYSVADMTVPPNYGPPPEQPNTPGYGYQSPYSGGQNPYGSQPQPPQPPYGGGGQQPPYGGGGQQPPYGQDPGAPYGGPILPPEPPKRNLGLIGGIIVGATVLVLGGALLVTMNLRNNEDDTTEAGKETSQEATEEATSAEEEATTAEEEPATEVGQCLPYEPVIAEGGYGDGLELVDCSDATAFWVITGQSYDVSDVPVDGEGNLTDFTVPKELCGEDWAVLKLGELWTNWHYVYSSGTLDSLYCIQATGIPDPNEPENLPYTPDTGDCFYDADDWWSVDCASSLAQYEVVDTVVFDEPVVMTEDEAADAATCGGEWYWQVTDPEGRTSAILCGNEL